MRSLIERVVMGPSKASCPAAKCEVGERGECTWGWGWGVLVVGEITNGCCHPELLRAALSSLKPKMNLFTEQLSSPGPISECTGAGLVAGPSCPYMALSTLT